MAKEIVPVGYQEFDNKDGCYPNMIHYHWVDKENTHLDIMPHWHAESEIWMLLNGTAAITQNRQSFIIQPGDIVFSGPYCVHSIRSVTARCDYCVIVLNKNHQYNSMISSSDLPPHLISNDPELQKIIKKIFEEHQNQAPMYQEVVNSLVSVLLANITRIWYVNQQNQHNESSQTNDSVQIAISYMNKHLAEKLTLNDVCSVVGYSEAYFNRMFHKSTGKSVIEFLNYLRCNQALYLIQNSDYSVGQVAVMSGFNNMSYFSRKFQEINGITPSEAKQRNRQTASNNPSGN